MSGGNKHRTKYQTEFAEVVSEQSNGELVGWNFGAAGKTDTVILKPQGPVSLAAFVEVKTTSGEFFRLTSPKQIREQWEGNIAIAEKLGLEHWYAMREVSHRHAEKHEKWTVFTIWDTVEKNGKLYHGEGMTVGEFIAFFMQKLK